MKHTKLVASIAAALTLSTALPALSQSAGDFTVGVGLGLVSPQDNTGTLAGFGSSIDDDVQPTLTFEYFIMDNLGIEVLAATPFRHTVALAGVGDVLNTSHLPPTITLKYHFDNGGTFVPFIGAGVNYTTFFNTKETAIGATLGNLSINDSFGLAANAGFDYKISEKGALRTEVRWMDIDASVKLNGTKIGTAKVDPWVFGVSYVHNF